ncbi:hypothetical protein ABI_02910 [Asticcacaulis biprosthecium C19]|uniref:Transmembrane protein n=1 Tax=Asticcacaulis biprosthecium C19 TaxID=715226 RepID=F4QJ28_9CAUL|nr:hypothetical protein [Asticcacaulis biprosthecium]EGF91859.1 hypothetical protein ABI_02910 [Asticcacaulis biprosthecium C19]
MMSNDEEAQKRELAQGFLHFLIDGAASNMPAGRTPTLADAIADRVSRDTRQQVDTLLPQYLNQILPGMVDQAVARGGAQSAFGRYGLMAVVAAGVLAVACIVLAVMLFAKDASNPATNAPISTSVADESVLPIDDAANSIGN